MDDFEDFLLFNNRRIIKPFGNAVQGVGKKVITHDDEFSEASVRLHESRAECSPCIIQSSGIGRYSVELGFHYSVKIVSGKVGKVLIKSLAVLFNLCGGAFVGKGNGGTVILCRNAELPECFG